MGRWGIVPSLVGKTSFAWAGGGGVGGIVPSLNFVEKTLFAGGGGVGGGGVGGWGGGRVGGWGIVPSLNFLGKTCLFRVSLPSNLSATKFQSDAANIESAHCCGIYPETNV